MSNTIYHDSETPAPNQQIITACAFIHKVIDGVEKVFLPKRANNKKFLPGVFELPGGHINYKEDIIEGLKREIKEEFNVNISVGDPFYVFTYYNNIKGSHSIEVIFFASFIDPIDKIKINFQDHSEYGWFKENDLQYVISNNKRENDPEIKAIQKGFSLLRGITLTFS